MLTVFHQVTIYKKVQKTPHKILAIFKEVSKLTPRTTGVKNVIFTHGNRLWYQGA